MNKTEARERLREYNLRFRTFEPERILFPEQLAFMRDASPYADAVCSRRSGKTVACAVDLLDTARRNKKSVCLYITLSRNNAKKIIWPELLRLNREYRLGGKPDHSELSIKFGDDSVVYLAGANDKSEIEKFRGLGLRLCYIDEVQSFPAYIEELVDAVLAPALMDYAGKLRLIGTPTPVPSGYFHDISTASHSSHHHWTFWDNPFIAEKSGLDHKEILDRELKRRGVTIDHPSIQREWFGRWTLDLESLLLHYNETKNHFEVLPPGKWDYIMGIDLGYVDADAIAILAWSETSPATYLLEESVVSKQGLTELVSSIQSLSSKYPVSKMVIDEGGLGKKIAEELRRRHAIPVQPADKIRKMENIALLNDALRTGRFKAKKDSRFAHDCFLLEIDRDKTTPDKIKIKDGFHSDIIDAVLYAAKESPAYAYEVPLPKLKVGTLEWAKATEDEMFNKHLERIQTEYDRKEETFEW